MPKIFKQAELEMKENSSPLDQFSWKSSDKLGELVQSRNLHFDIKSLNPGKFSYPYHFHHNAEELMIVLEGEVTLRTPEGFKNQIKSRCL